MEKSLSEVHSSVDVTKEQGFWKRLFAFLGPAYLISVGYMDPGNWATDIAGGSRFGYALIWVLLLSNIMAQLLQALSARLGIVSGLDLAQASRLTYSKIVNLFLYILAEIAIAACDLAEVLGMAIGLNLLFGLPLLWGVSISVLDTFLLLFLINFGIRKIEAFILSLVTIIGVSFLIQMFMVKPAMGELVKGFIPSMPNESALYIAIGIIGATVMPHNLYLHSSLVQTRKFGKSDEDIRRALKYNLIDTVVALNLAFFVNAAILVLAASAFYKNGYFEVSEIQDAYHFLEPLLGYEAAPILFAIALIAAGQSSTITGTLAGQIVMEGYLNLRIQPWIRRLLTRLVAIVPAFLVIFFMGEKVSGELLILSQVILSLQLGFAIIPLIHFVSNPEKMGKFVIKRKTKIFAWLFASIIVVLNVKLVVGEISGWIEKASPENLWILYGIVVPLALGTGILLIYIALAPFLHGATRHRAHTPHGPIQSLRLETAKKYGRIAISVDFSSMDSPAINEALRQGGKTAEYCLIHVVETAGAMMFGYEIKDHETLEDVAYLKEYEKTLSDQGYSVSYKLGFGNPKKAIPILVKEYKADLLLIGAHGHNTLMDILLGTTVDKVRHGLDIPVFIVR